MAKAKKPELQVIESSAPSSVHDVLVHKIGQAIVAGMYPPHSQLPAEEELVATMDASRTSIREAVRTLSALGLVESRARVGVIVQNPDRWRLLDPPVLGWYAASIAGPDFAAMVQETRRIFEPAASGLAAERATSADLAAIEAQLMQMKANLHSRVHFVEADIGFHRAILKATRNPMLIALTGTIEASLRYFFTHSVERATEAIPRHERLLEHIRMRDAPGAMQATYDMLELATSDQAYFDMESSTKASKAV